jgi:hypothetical protein
VLVSWARATLADNATIAAKSAAANRERADTTDNERIIKFSRAG